MKEHKLLIKVHKEINKKIEEMKTRSWTVDEVNEGIEKRSLHMGGIVRGLYLAKEIIDKEIESNKERKNIHHKDIQKNSKSESRKKVHST